ncbi:Uncharacterized protein Rs2_48032 [Raphanus sativus]|nr:Uncharacterized protein Rs2_48032 [Raphanus sativus]
MAFSPNEKKDSDVEMSEANQASPAQDTPALTQTFVEGFSSFQEKMERRRAEMESSVAGPSATSCSDSRSDVTLTPDPAALSWTRCYSSPDLHTSSLWTRCPFACWRNCCFGASTRCPGSSGGFSFGADSGFGGCGGSHASSSREKEGDRLGTSRINAVPPSRGRSRAGLSDQRREKGVLGVRKARFRRDYRSIAPRYFFVSLIDGMLGDCGLEVTRLSKELDSSRETLKRTEAVLQSIESTHAAQTSTLEARISDLERDLGKTVSSLLKAKEEKKSKSSEVRRLKRRIQRFEETGTCTAVELAGPSSSGTLVPGSEIPEVQDARVAADKGGEEVGEGNGEAVPCFG